MQDGDRYGVERSDVVADANGHPFVRAEAVLHSEGGGNATVVKCGDGYHLDLSNVPPSVRFERINWYTGKVYRVHDVKGAVCVAS